MHIFDLHRTRQSKRFKAAAVALDCYAAEIQRIGLMLDDSAETCSCCDSARYRNFPQKQLRDRVDGAAIRLREIAETFRRRAYDTDFLGEPKPDQDLLVRALVQADESAADTELGVTISHDAFKAIRKIVRGNVTPPESFNE